MRIFLALVGATTQDCVEDNEADIAGCRDLANEKLAECEVGCAGDPS